MININGGILIKKMKNKSKYIVLIYFGMESYSKYLLNKYLIFKDNIGNELKEFDKFKGNIKSDMDFIKITKRILDEFLCFEINVNINIDSRINVCEAEKIFYHYKKYKCSTSDVRETESYLNLDDKLDTSKTQWVESIDIITSDLIHKYGNYIRTGKDNDNYRFEYKFEFIDKGKRWIFSVYDYLNTDDLFDNEDDIYWHIASNTKRGDIIKNFIKMLREKECC